MDGDKNKMIFLKTTRLAKDSESSSNLEDSEPVGVWKFTTRCLDAIDLGTSDRDCKVKDNKAYNAVEVYNKDGDDNNGSSTSS